MAFAQLKALSFLGLSLSISSPNGADWRFSNPKPHGNNILDMALKDGVVWQIGDRGQIYTSQDLDTWIPRKTGTTRSLRAIASFGSKTFISTEAGGILVATSLDDYSLLNLGTSNWLEGIAASPNTLVAVGDNGAIFSSPDGTVWTPRGNFTTWLRSVAYGNNLFVTVGEDGFLATSSDGNTWEKRSLNTSVHLNKVDFIFNRFWVVGDAGTVLTNNARMTFVPVNINATNTLFAVAGNTNEVVVAGDSALFLGNLQSGIWSVQADEDSPTLAPLWPYYSALWDGRLFLVGGRTGLKVEGFRTNAAAPMQWYGDPQPTREWLWSATRGPGFYAACGADGTIVTSEEGLDWHRESVPAAAVTEVLLGIGGNTNALLAVGSRGIILRAPNVVTNTVSTNASGQIVTNQTSLFGVIWEQPASPATEDLQAVAANDSTFLIGGAKGALFTSGNGISWQPRSSGVTDFLSGATAWPGGWVVCGAAGALLTSPNAANWKRVTPPINTWIYTVHYVGGKLVAVGENGVILTSDDASSWTARTSGTSEWLNDVTYAKGRWYIAGTAGMVLSSPDLATWTVTPTITSKSLYSAVTDGEQLIMTGLEGVILRQQLESVVTPVNFESIGADSTETLFLFSGSADQRFTLEESTRLEGPWSPTAVLEITDSSGILIHALPHAPGSRFFRTRLLLP